MHTFYNNNKKNIDNKNTSNNNKNTTNKNTTNNNNTSNDNTSKNFSNNNNTNNNNNVNNNGNNSRGKIPNNNNPNNRNRGYNNKGSQNSSFSFHHYQWRQLSQQIQPEQPQQLGRIPNRSDKKHIPQSTNQKNHQSQSFKPPSKSSIAMMAIGQNFESVLNDPGENPVYVEPSIGNWLMSMRNNYNQDELDRRAIFEKAMQKIKFGFPPPSHINSSSSSLIHKELLQEQQQQLDLSVKKYFDVSCLMDDIIVSSSGKRDDSADETEGLLSEFNLNILRQREINQMDQLIEREDIPAIFFQPGFCLENPVIFRTVYLYHCSAALQNDDTPQKEKGIIHNSCQLLLLEKLFHYVDKVESAITHQISFLSDDFIRLIKHHDSLQEDAKKIGEEISKLRIYMEGPLREAVLNKPFRVYKLLIRRKNLMALLCPLEELSWFNSAIKEIEQSLLKVIDTNNGETAQITAMDIYLLNTALGNIDKYQSALLQNKHMSTTVKESFSNRLLNSLTSAKQLLILEFLKIVKVHQNSRMMNLMNSLPTQILAWVSANNSLWIAKEDKEEIKKSQILSMISERNYESLALEQFGNALVDVTIKICVKSILNQSLGELLHLENATFARGWILDKRIQYLSQKGFISLLDALFKDAFKLVLQSLWIMNTVIDNGKDAKKITANSDRIKDLQKQCRGIIIRLCEAIYFHCSIVVKVRAWNSKNLPEDVFMAMVAKINAFIALVSSTIAKEFQIDDNTNSVDNAKDEIRDNHSQNDIASSLRLVLEDQHKKLLLNKEAQEGGKEA